MWGQILNKVLANGGKNRLNRRKILKISLKNHAVRRIEVTRLPCVVGPELKKGERGSLVHGGHAEIERTTIITTRMGRHSFNQLRILQEKCGSVLKELISQAPLQQYIHGISLLSRDMPVSLSVKMEEHAFFILFIAFIVVLFWHAVWELSNEFVEHLHEKYGVKKTHIYVVYLLIVILMIGLFPQVLEKI
jgi:hypothetical protein